jgi:thioredoxin 1
MSEEDIKKLSEESFEKDVSQGTVLVDFYADWCGPCRMMAPVLEKVARDLKGKAVVAQLDIDRAQRVASSFQITSIPTLILFREGKESGRIVGLRDEEAIKDFVSKG